MWTPEESHEHSLQTLTLLDGFDDFKASIKHLADFGCGQGKDLEFFANMRELTEEGLPGRYLDFNCVGFDISAETLTPQRHNITYKNLDLNTEGPIWSVPFDIIWCHDVMQYIHSPVNFLRLCNNSLNTGGMIYLHVPTTVNVMHHIFQHYTPSQHLNTFTVTQIIYLLAINGFDVKDFYMNKHKYDDNIEVVCYKERDPLPYGTSWYEMVDMDILSDNIKEVVLSNNILSDQGLLITWLDGVTQDFRWHS
jgi:SAM-dependent methyltransferase